jgi:hypothetical protein
MEKESAQEPRNLRWIYLFALAPLVYWVALLPRTRVLPEPLQWVIGGSIMIGSLGLLVASYAVNSMRLHMRLASEARAEAMRRRREDSALRNVLLIIFELLLRQKSAERYDLKWAQTTFIQLTKFLQTNTLAAFLDLARDGELPFELAPGTPVTTISRASDELQFATKYL